MAHRGATQNAQENTLAAFKEAARLGAAGVELDVRRTTDGHLVIHHDAALPGGERIAALRRADLPAWLPTLDEALEACQGIVNVEVKNVPIEPEYEPDGALGTESAAAVMEHGMADRVIVSCFDLRTIDAVRAAQPDVPTGWLTLAGYDQHQALDAVARRGHPYLHPQEGAITAELMAGANQAGVGVVAWTVNDPARMRELAQLGVHALITDDVSLALSALARSAGPEPPSIS